jgi:hypothetical protein
MSEKQDSSKPHVCPMCREDPESHSLAKVREVNGTAIFYTAPAKAKSLDKEGVIRHYDLVLSENTQPWMWVFDCKDFPLSHALDMPTAIELTKLINDKFSHNLQKIIVINSTTFIYVILKTISFFMSDETNKKIHVSDQQYDL